MAKLEQLKIALDEYAHGHRHADRPQLVISHIYDLHPENHQSNSPQKEFIWPAKWPYSDNPGVYVVLDQTLNILYVGKASLKSTLGRRLTVHFPDGQQCKPAENWQTKPKYVLTIPFLRDSGFEAPSLEEFLILKLAPSENIQGKRNHQ